MKKSINAWSIPASVSFEDMFAQIAAAGFEAIELNIDQAGSSAHSLDMAIGQPQLGRIKELSQKYHLPVCSISTSLYGPNTLGSANPEGRQNGQAVLRKQLICAQALGADSILVVPGGISDDVSMRQAYENSMAALSEMRDEINRSGIKVGLENVWNSFFLSPFDMRDFIDRLDSPYIGAYFDVGNVAVFSHSEHWIEILGQRIVKIHVKDFQRAPSWFSGHFVNLLEGSVDWPKVARALKNAGYQDVLTAELAPIPQNPELLYHMTAEALTYIINQA
ncbi:MAG: sugar phosphate isomerase/epimerase family protein [Clostridiaceae bacterium]|nr:sugar phosphate isomerase/epimerase family protein [Clostridiaceae bacterium]